MTSFRCEKCNVDIVDTPKGYITECEHFKLGRDDEVGEDQKRADVLLLPNDVKILHDALAFCSKV